jgi:hypothetical protein
VHVNGLKDLRILSLRHKLHDMKPYKLLFELIVDFIGQHPLIPRQDIPVCQHIKPLIIVVPVGHVDAFQQLLLVLD